MKISIQFFAHKKGVGSTKNCLLYTSYTTHTQALDAVARSLPALWRARKIQKRASEAGFQWSDPAAPVSYTHLDVYKRQHFPLLPPQRHPGL